MANIVFHNNTVSMNDMWYDSHAQLVRMVAFDLKASSEQIDELLEKYVGKKQKMKAQKNPFQPKKPKSSYFYFCDDFRPKLIENFKKKNPNKKVSIADIAKDLGKKWKDLKDKDKKKYHQLLQVNIQNKEIQIHYLNSLKIP